MRLSLSRLTALFVIGVALATVPGAVAVRVGGRERDRGARMTTTRGGSQRLDASDPTSHGHEETAPDVTDASDVLRDLADDRSLAGPPGILGTARVVAPRPPGDSVLLHASPLATVRTFEPFLLTPGRGPPVL